MPSEKDKIFKQGRLPTYKEGVLFYVTLNYFKGATYNNCEIAKKIYCFIFWKVAQLNLH